MNKVNPSTGKIAGEINYIELPELQRKIHELKEKQLQWKNLKISDRLKSIKKLKQNLENKKEHYAKIISEDMGKPIKFALQEINKCVALCDYCIKNAEKSVQDNAVKTEYLKSYTKYQPLGNILIIAPWNYPFWLALRPVIPALCVGNGIILKNASAVPLVSKALSKLFSDSGLKQIALSIQTKPETTNALIEKNLVDGVGIIGGSSTGRIVARNAAQNLKPHLLELGGSNPFIVFEDADLELAAKEVVISRMLNSGQSCDGAKRIIVHKKIAHAFENLLISEVNKLKIGFPTVKETDIGPLISESACSDMVKYIEDAKNKGARLIYGGHRLNRDGFYFMPTILSDVSTEMKVFQEEVFGPVLPITTFESEKEALELANNSPYGLGASIWTKNKKTIDNFIEHLNVGMVSVNKRTSSDIRLPFGGVKNSGYGRELGIEGFRIFTNLKTVIVN